MVLKTQAGSLGYGGCVVLKTQAGSLGYGGCVVLKTQAGSLGYGGYGGYDGGPERRTTLAQATFLASSSAER